MKAFRCLAAESIFQRVRPLSSNSTLLSARTQEKDNEWLPEAVDSIQQVRLPTEYGFVNAY
eukprot:4294730-Pleurochrysis_carterae.AAC.1